MDTLLAQSDISPKGQNVLGAVLPLLKLLSLTIIGLVLAHPKTQIIPRATFKLLSKLVFALFLPCTIFVHLGESITLENFIQWWFIPVNVIISTAIGCILGGGTLDFERFAVFYHLQGLVKSKMSRENQSAEALVFLRSRICNSKFVFSPFTQLPDSNFSKLKFLISSSITEACNNSVLLLGPRGCGQTAVLELVLEDLWNEYPDMLTVIKLNGLLHGDDNCALKEISRQLCEEHQLLFSKMASFDDNSQFMIAMLRECGLAHKTVIFVLDEFDLFAQGKQRLLYSLLDAMQSVSSQAVVIGLSCRLDADQLLEKRVRSRFSHRKLLFLPPSKEDYQRLLQHILVLPSDSSLSHDYVTEFNTKVLKLLAEEKFKQIIDTLSVSDSTFNHLLRFLFFAICRMDLNSGFLKLDNFKAALSNIQRQPKMETLKDCSVLELFILVCMRRLEVKEQDSYNFNSVMKEYKSIHDSFQTSDYYSWNVCLQAFEHLLDRELISSTNIRGHNQSIEFRPVKLLITPHELYHGLKSHKSCPMILQKVVVG